jgi:hypothetical protein
MKNKTKTNLVFGLLFTLVGILGILGISLFVGLILWHLHITFCV